jgi:protein TonB
MARETLRDPARRREYDAALGHAGEPDQHDPETSASPIPAPFMAAPPQAQAIEPSMQAGDQPMEAAPSPPISDPVQDSAPDLPEPVVEPTLPPERNGGAFMASPASNLEQQEDHASDVRHDPDASVGSNVAPFVFGAMHNPLQRRDYYRPAARSAEPEPAVESEPDPEPEPELVREPEPQSRGGGRSDVVPTDEWSNSEAFILRAEDPQPRRRLLPALAAIAVLLLAVTAIMFVVRPSELGFGSGQQVADGRTGVNADGSPLASTTVPPNANQTIGIEETLSPAPDGAEGMVFGTVAPGEMLSVPPPVGSAPTDQPATSQEAAAVPNAPPSGETTAVATSEVAPTDPLAPATESTPVPVAATPPAVVAEPARPAPAPVMRQQPVPARLVSGGLTSSDNPRGRFKGTVSVQFTVEKTGQVTGCRPTASSGNPALDARTCALVGQKLRFSPAVDSQGRAVPSVMYGTYNWGKNRRSLTGRLLDIVRR